MAEAVTAIHGLAWFAIWYFLALNSACLVFLALAVSGAVQDTRRGRFAGLADIFASPLAPPISVVVPVRDMAGVIAASTRGLLGLRYPEFEVIVVDDGSTDGTFARLQAEFGLARIDKVLRDEAATDGRVLSVHAPRDGCPLLVIRTQGTGCPADAVNVGINAAAHPVVCRVDAGTYLDTDALLTVAKPFVEDPARVVAAGAAIRVANGCEISGGRVTRPRVGAGWLVPVQAAEYLRSFLLGRAGWSQIRGMLFASGAFAAYRRDIVEQAGGFGPGGDLEMTLRIHHRLRDEQQPYRIGFVAEPCCWTVVPGSYRRLARQRARWSQALTGALWAHRAMLLDGRYGVVGMLLLPFCLLFELGSAVVELLAVAALAAGLVLGVISPGTALLVAVAGPGYGAFLTVIAVIIEELLYHRYHCWRDLALLLYAAVAESAGFRQLHAWWRLRGIAAAVMRRGTARAGRPGAREAPGRAPGVPAGERQAGTRHAGVR